MNPINPNASMQTSANQTGAYVNLSGIQKTENINAIAISQAGQAKADASFARSEQEINAFAFSGVSDDKMAAVMRLLYPQVSQQQAKVSNSKPVIEKKPSATPPAQMPQVPNAKSAGQPISSKASLKSQGTDMKNVGTVLVGGICMASFKGNVGVNVKCAGSGYVEVEFLEQKLQNN